MKDSSINREMESAIYQVIVLNVFENNIPILRSNLSNSFTTATCDLDGILKTNSLRVTLL
ncbi:hypothetical protein [Clostridium lacusfryxellense]|uniref:hypothetical protein n=1 Tax=Clostridium lacusfryxellense TaxID=205328 RepID=UPI001C0C8B04|nr:hypothetical protein [Clostridium lacusfryxellense]MBU3114448.1 hypothetical protein [Clostridium lacusfryxellense]